MSENNSEILSWHDLSADDTYYIAGIEDQAREMFSNTLAQISYRSTASEIAEITERATQIIRHNDDFAQKWLADLALSRKLMTEYQPTIQSESAMNIEDVTGAELRTIRQGLGYSQKALPFFPGLSQSTVSRIERGLDVSQHVRARYINLLDNLPPYTPITTSE